MSKTISDREIDEFLLPHVGTDASSRGRLLAVIEILRVFTDEKEGLTAKEISRIIGKRCGKEPSENTVLNDLAALAANPPFGMKVIAASKGDKTGYRCVQRFVTPDEASVLVNLVKTCKFMSPDQREALSSKLLEVIPLEKQDEVVETVFVDERQTSNFVDVFEAANASSKAIREGRSVRFKYVTHLMNGTIAERDVEEEEPIALVYSFGHYYLETYSPGANSLSEGLRLRRLDRVKDVSPGKRIKSKEQVSQLSKSVVRDISERFDMLGDGICRTLFLSVEGSHAKYVYDRFGHDIKFEHVNEKEGVGYACIKIQLSPTLFRWLFGMSPKITLFNPPGLTWIRAFDAYRHCDIDTLKSCKADYDEAREAYVKLLVEALDCEVEHGRIGCLSADISNGVSI